MNVSGALFERVMPATAGLQVRVGDGHPSVGILGAERTGSGVFVDAAGLLLTVNYVVIGAQAIEVTTVAGETHAGMVVAMDFASGLAVIRVDAPEPFPVVSLRSSADTTLGQEVLLIASTGRDNRRATSGAISGLAPFDAYWEYRLERAILTTAMNPGLGGGGLFDLAGNLIGLVSLDLGEVGRLTMAIPIERYIEQRAALLRSRRPTAPPRAWLGVYCYTVRNHVVIAGVLPGGPGEQAGLKGGDVVLGVDGQEVHTRGELYEITWTHRPGDKVALEIFRDNEVRRLEVASASVEDFFA